MFNPSIMRPLLGLGLLLAVASTAPAAKAELLVPLTIEQMTDASDYIVRGTVNSVWVDQDNKGTHRTHVQIEVDAVVKGPANLDAIELSVMGGTLNGQATIVADAPRFSEEEEVLVFAERTKTGKLIPTGWSQGKYTIRVDPDDGREMLVQFTPPAWVPYDPRFLPHPAPANRLYLDDLLTEVHTRMIAGWQGEPIPGKSMERLNETHRAAGQEVQP